MGADNKATLEEIEAFLNEFKTKSKVFGIGIKKKRSKRIIPIYIKIYITRRNGEANFCISFHEAKFDMVFPYKNQL